MPTTITGTNISLTGGCYNLSTTSFQVYSNGGGGTVVDSSEISAIVVS